MFPYTYLIGWSKLNKFYYGAQWGKSANPNNLWNSYFTSSDAVKSFRKQFGEPDIIQVRKVFETKEKCWGWEKRTLIKLKARQSDKFLNRSNGYGKFDTNIGTVPVKTRDGKRIGRVSKNDPKYVNGEYVHTSTGLPRSAVSMETINKIKDWYNDDQNMKTHRTRTSQAMSDLIVKSKLIEAHKRIDTCKYCSAKMKRPAIDLYHNNNCPTINESVIAPCKGRKWYNDGMTNFMRYPQDAEGLSQGRI